MVGGAAVTLASELGLEIQAWPPPKASFTAPATG